MAALWREEALVCSGAFEEAGDIVGANPVSTTWRLTKQFTFALLAAADNAALRHVERPQ